VNSFIRFITFPIQEIVSTIVKNEGRRGRKWAVRRVVAGQKTILLKGGHETRPC
jgi:hypothetical protein